MHGSLMRGQRVLKASRFIFLLAWFTSLFSPEHSYRLLVARKIELDEYGLFCSFSVRSEGFVWHWGLSSLDGEVGDLLTCKFLWSWTAGCTKPCHSACYSPPLPPSHPGRSRLHHANLKALSGCCCSRKQSFLHKCGRDSNNCSLAIQNKNTALLKSSLLP